MENKFKDVMSKNSFKKLQEIINNPNDWQSEALSAAKSELDARNIEFEILYKTDLKNLSDKEFENIIKNEDYYPDELLIKIKSSKKKLIDPMAGINIKPNYKLMEQEKNYGKLFFYIVIVEVSTFFHLLCF